MAVKTRRRVAQARHIADYAERWAARVARRLEASAPEGPPPVDLSELENVQRYFAERLRIAAGVLETTEREYEQEKETTARLRSERDEAAGRLYRRLVEVRGLIAHAYGKHEVQPLLGLTGKTPREPYPLAWAARIAVERLVSETLEVPPPRMRGFALDRRALAAALEPDVAALEKLTLDVLESTKGEDVRQLRRDQALARFREIRTGTARVLEGLYRTAELDHLVPGLRNPQTALTPHSPAAAKPVPAAVHPPDARRRNRTARVHRSSGRWKDRTARPHRSFGCCRGRTEAVWRSNGARRGGAAAVLRSNGRRKGSSAAEWRPNGTRRAPPGVGWGWSGWWLELVLCRSIDV